MCVLRHTLAHIRALEHTNNGYFNVVGDPKLSVPCMAGPVTNLGATSALSCLVAHCCKTQVREPEMVGSNTAVSPTQIDMPSFLWLLPHTWNFPGPASPPILCVI